MEVVLEVVAGIDIVAAAAGAGRERHQGGQDVQAETETAWLVLRHFLFISIVLFYEFVFFGV